MYRSLYAPGLVVFLAPSPSLGRSHFPQLLRQVYPSILLTVVPYSSVLRWVASLSYVWCGLTRVLEQRLFSQKIAGAFHCQSPYIQALQSLALSLLWRHLAELLQCAAHSGGPDMCSLRTLFTMDRHGDAVYLTKVLTKVVHTTYCNCGLCVS